MCFAFSSTRKSMLTPLPMTVKWWQWLSLNMLKTLVSILVTPPWSVHHKTSIKKPWEESKRSVLPLETPSTCLALSICNLLLRSGFFHFYTHSSFGTWLTRVNFVMKILAVKTLRKEKRFANLKVFCTCVSNTRKLGYQQKLWFSDVFSDVLVFKARNTWHF